MYWKNWLPGRETWIYYLIIVLFVLRILIPPQHTTTQYSDSLVERRTNSLMPVLPDSVSWRSYNQTKDSITRNVIIENGENTNRGTSWGVLNIGIAHYKVGGYFLFMDGYEMPPGFDYYSENRRNFLEWLPHNESAGRNKIETKVKLLPEDNNEQVSVLLPLSDSFAIVVSILLALTGVALLVFSLFCFVGLPFRILKNISRRKVFNQANIDAFRVMGSFLLIYAGAAILLPVILDLAFGNKIPEVIHLSYYNIIMENAFTIIGGLVCLEFSKAFRRGYELEEEKQLTI